jgi:6-bladed beta-propeller
MTRTVERRCARSTSGTRLRRHRSRQCDGTGGCIVACTLLFFLAACSDSSNGDHGGVLIDTVAGVVRVQNAAGEAWRVEPWTLGDAVVIGGALESDERYSFGRISGITVLDGRTYVADGQAKEVRVFDGGGRFLFRFGRNGEGPGEFRILDAIASAPDGTILTRDARLSRITRFDAEGRYLADYPLRQSYPQYSDGTSFRITHDGWIYDRLSLSLGIRSTDSLAIIVYDDTGVVRDTVLLAESPRKNVVVTENGMPMAGLPVPFLPWAIATTSPDGHIARTPGDRFTFDVLSPSGTIERTVLLDVAVVAVTSSEHDSLMSKMRRDAGEMTDGQGEMSDFTFPSTKPAITFLMGDAEGYWWAGASGSSNRLAPPGRLHIFDADGIRVGSLEIGMRPIEIGTDWIAGIASDSLGVETVVIRTLHRSGTVPPDPPDLP